MNRFLRNINSCGRAQRVMRRAGLFMVYAGALMLIVSYFFGWTDINFLLFACLLFIAAGIVLHVAMLKRESKY